MANRSITYAKLNKLWPGSCWEIDARPIHSRCIADQSPNERLVANILI